MEAADHIAHSVLGVIAAFANVVLSLMDGIEIGLRTLMEDVGLSPDIQTLILLLIVFSALVGARTMLKGFLRTAATLVLLLVFAHVASVIARHGALTNYTRCE